MNLVVRIPDELVNRITAAGADPEQLALAALRHAANELERREPPAGRPAGGHVADRHAAARIRQNRVGNTLPPSVTIRDFIDYGRD